MECRYAQIEKECLALKWVFEKFAYSLEGIPFSLLSHHNPLISQISSSKIRDNIPPHSTSQNLPYAFLFRCCLRSRYQMKTANALLRLLLDNQPALITSSDVIKHYVSAVMDVLPLVKVATEKIK